MEHIIKFFSGSVYFNLFAFITAISALVLSYYFYLKGKKVKIPIYIIETFQLWSRTDVKLFPQTYILSVEDKNIDNYTVTRFRLGNVGRETINYEDIAQADPLRIVIDPDYEIFHLEIKSITNKANNFKAILNEDNKEILITFDYFNFGDSATIHFYHNGESSNNIKLLGSIKSVKKIKEYISRRSPLITKSDIALLIMPVSIFVGFLILYLAYFFYNLTLDKFEMISHPLLLGYALFILIHKILYLRHKIKIE